VQLHFFETAVSLFFILHVEDFDQLERDDHFVLLAAGLENVRELALAD